jgi:hypothetical protein
VLGRCLDKVLGMPRSDDEGEYKMTTIMGDLINDQHGSNDDMQFTDIMLILTILVNEGMVTVNEGIVIGTWMPIMCLKKCPT